MVYGHRTEASIEIYDFVEILFHSIVSRQLLIVTVFTNFFKKIEVLGA